MLFGLDGPGANRPDAFLVGTLPPARRPAFIASRRLPRALRSPRSPGFSAATASIATGTGRPSPPARRSRRRRRRGGLAHRQRSNAGAISSTRRRTTSGPRDRGGGAGLGEKHRAVETAIVGDEPPGPHLPDGPCHRPRLAPRSRGLSTCLGRGGHAPRVTIVGKGVAFDTGGLNLKPDASDGADEEGHGRRRRRDRACRHGPWAPGSRLRLRLLVAAVENAVSGQRLPARRCAREPQGPLGRNRQHRRRGAPDPRRRARACQ